jgi:hypothetical protein
LGILADFLLTLFLQLGFIEFQKTALAQMFIRSL